MHHAPVPTRPIWETALFEAGVLADASYFLAVHGFYEEACAMLRGLLDGFLTRLYWDTVQKNGKLDCWSENGRSTNRYWEWESGKRHAYPKVPEIWNTLLGEYWMGEYDRAHAFRAETDALLAMLNKFVHGRPESRHEPGASRSSLVNIEFSKEHFETWWGHLRSIYRLVSVLSILQYPDLMTNAGGQEFAELEPEAAARLASVFNLTARDGD